MDSHAQVQLGLRPASTARRLDELLHGLEAAVGSSVRRLETLLQGHNDDEGHGVSVDADQHRSPEKRRTTFERYPSGRPGSSP